LLELNHIVLPRIILMPLARARGDPHDSR